MTKARIHKIPLSQKMDDRKVNLSFPLRASALEDWIQERSGDHVQVFSGINPCYSVGDAYQIPK